MDYHSDSLTMGNLTFWVKLHIRVGNRGKVRDSTSEFEGVHLT